MLKLYSIRINKRTVIYNLKSKICSLLALLLVFILFSCGEEAEDENGDSVSFTDQTAPEIVSSYPKDGSIDLNPEEIKTISVEFSEPIATSKAKIIITPDVPFRVSWQSNRMELSLTLKEELAEATTYTVELRDIIDRNGNVLNKASFNFRTQAAGIGDMVYIPAGEFTMGSEDGEDDESPVHTVYLDAFYIDKYEVTNAQFKEFSEETGHKGMINQPGFEDYIDYFNNCPNCPIVNITWYYAKDYAKWAGKRLPTEAEWEKAARGTDEREYSWGDESPDADEIFRANYRTPSEEGGADGFRFAAPVGSFPENKSPYGAFDMAGNVWEWVADWYDSEYYTYSPKRNPEGPERSPIGGKVMRGGSWDMSPRSIRCANRYGRDGPGDWFSDVGFRCAKDASE